MNAAHAQDAIVLDLPEGSVPVLLFAGGTTGLLLLASSEPARRVCAGLGEVAEAAGLSALAFDGAVSGDLGVAADRGMALLRSLGVENVVLLASGEDAAAALRAAAGPSAAAAVVLVEPRLPDKELEALLAHVPAPKLVLVPANDPYAQAVAAAAYRYAIGPLVVQHLPGGSPLAGETAAMVAEAATTFAIGACGDGRVAVS